MDQLERIHAIQNLTNGRHCEINTVNDGGFEVWRINDVLFLFEIPLFGGDPVFVQHETVNNIDRIIESINSLT